MQTAYISKLMEIAEKDKRVLHLIADSGTGYDEMFKKNFPNQIFNFGIQEENMVAASSGFAMEGKIPFVYTAGAFLAYRSLEFIRDDICLQNRNVKIVGMGSGLSWSTLGVTHHTTEDIAVLNSMPNLTILSPATPKEVEWTVEYAYNIDSPVYIRIGMNHEKEFYEDKIYDKIADGEDILIISTGSILEEAYSAVNLLKNDNVKARLINICKIKPFDINKEYFNIKKRKVVTIEEHNIIGGIGSIVADYMIRNDISMPLLKIGLDGFAKGYGTIKEVREYNNLDSLSIYKRIREFL